MRESVELRLEQFKRLSNLTQQLFECFYNGHSIDERYIDEEVMLHIHGLFHNYGFCATWAKGQPDPSFHHGQLSVLVRVGDVTETTRPIASITRLQRLDGGNVFLADSFEKAACPSIEDIFSIVNRKLRAVLDFAGVQACQLIDEIVQRGSHVIDGLANENAKERGDRRDWERDPSENTHHFPTIGELEQLRLAVNDNLITYLAPEGIDSSLQISQVLVSPTSPLISAIQWVHDAHSGHGHYQGS